MPRADIAHTHREAVLHCKNKIVKVTILLVSTVASI